MGKPIIQDHAPSDGREYDCQCARCGSDVEFVDCQECGGDGVTHHDCGEDTCCCADPEDNVDCWACGGGGTWPKCVSGDEWCEAHPLPGREQQACSTAEWFLAEPATAPTEGSR